MNRLIILMAITGAVIFAGVWFFGENPEGEKTEPAVNQASESGDSSALQIEYMTVRTESRAQVIRIEGRIRSENRLELFPEVQGTIAGFEKPFREGMAFREGKTLLQLDSEEASLQLRASRSGFQALIASLLPDIKLDYPDELDRFEAWFARLHPEEELPLMPGVENEQLGRFLASRGVSERYYQIKSAESRLRKYTIKAPFSGVLSAVNAEPGQSVGPQNHLGTFVDPTRFVLTAAVQQHEAQKIPAGSELMVRSRQGHEAWTAVVRRFNPTVSERTQMVEIYLDVSGIGLREGMYLEGTFTAGQENEFAQIPKTALLRTGHVYIRENGIIRQEAVEVTDVEKEMIWVSGLKTGDEIVQNANRPLAGFITQ